MCASLQNVQYYETDQINKLPTWGILFNQTLTKEHEINTIIKIISVSIKWEHESFFLPRKSDCSGRQREKKIIKRVSIEKAHVLYADGRFYFLNHLCDDQPLHQDMKGQAELCNSKLDVKNQHSRKSTWARMLIFCSCKLCQPCFCVTWEDICSYSDRFCFVSICYDLFQPKNTPKQSQKHVWKVQSVTRYSGPMQSLGHSPSGSANNPGCPAQLAHCRDHKRSGWNHQSVTNMGRRGLRGGSGNALKIIMLHSRHGIGFWGWETVSFKKKKKKWTEEKRFRTFLTYLHLTGWWQKLVLFALKLLFPGHATRLSVSKAVMYAMHQFRITRWTLQIHS